MGDVNLEIKLNNIDERLIKVEENGGSGGGGDSYIESVSSDFKVVNKKLSLSDIIKTAITSISNKLNKPESANDGDALVYDSDSNEWLPKQIESENYINDVSNDFNVIDKLLSLKDDIKNKINSIGDISLLGTVDKTDIVSAINSLTVGGVNNGIYTEDEIIIGQWIDNKPIYRKTVIITTNSTNYTVNARTILSPDIDKLISRKGWCLVDNGNVCAMLPCYYGTGAFKDLWMSINTKEIHIYSGSQYTNSTVYAVLDYTKTTD